MPVILLIMAVVFVFCKRRKRAKNAIHRTANEHRMQNSEETGTKYNISLPTINIADDNRRITCKCENCGANIDSESNFCKYCGTKLLTNRKIETTQNIYLHDVAKLKEIESYDAIEKRRLDYEYKNKREEMANKHDSVIAVAMVLLIIR